MKILFSSVVALLVTVTAFSQDAPTSTPASAADVQALRQEVQSLTQTVKTLQQQVKDQQTVIDKAHLTTEEVPERPSILSVQLPVVEGDYSRRKLTSIVAITGTGLPSFMPGLKRHFSTASMAF